VLPPGILAWDTTQQTVDATNGQDFARFEFSFTNLAKSFVLAQVTNIVHSTNFTLITNSDFWDVFSGRKYSSIPTVTTRTNVNTITNGAVPAAMAVLSVHPSCGCTTADVPPMPWILPPETNGLIHVKVDLAGKIGMVFKTVTVATEKGRMDLVLRVNIAPPPPPRMMTEAERAAGVAAAKADRQAVFRGTCASCHASNVSGKYGQQLYELTCKICHDANPRASMVPDLHNLKDPTSEEFWRAWITSGKPGTLMPAFSTAQGGPLNDFQIASLAAYLNAIIPSKVPPQGAR
jgi:mono/diheme cytochrome c family protein